MRGRYILLKVPTPFISTNLTPTLMLAIKPQKAPVFNNDEELQKFLTQSFTESLKQAIKVTVKIMIKTEMEQFRKDGEQKLSFNGCYGRDMITTYGKIADVPIPRFRELPQGNIPLQTMNIFTEEKDKFLKLVSQMHELGISTRKIEKLCKTTFGVTMPKNQVSLIHKELAEQEELQINSLALTDEFEYIILDGLWAHCKTYGLTKDKKLALLCALGITKEGKRKIIGFRTAEAEDTENWGKLLADLKKRGLSGKTLTLAIADDNAGLAAALAQYYPTVKTQICIVHKMRNVMSATRNAHKEAVTADLKYIYTATTTEEAIERMKTFAKKWYIHEEKAVNSLRFHFEKTITYLQFPEPIWKKIRTSNILEREFREVRRRINVFDNSFNGDKNFLNYGNTIFNYLNTNYPRHQHVTT